MKVYNQNDIPERKLDSHIYSGDYIAYIDNSYATIVYYDFEKEDWCYEASPTGETVDCDFKYIENH